jgi:hypothetical protein
MRGLDPAPFLPLYGRSATALSAFGIERVIADAHYAKRGCYAARIERA